MIGEVFNKMCKIGEKIDDKNMIKALEKANLFLIERESLKGTDKEIIRQFVSTGLPLLPFNVCAIEVDNIITVSNESVPGCILIEITSEVDKDSLSNFKFNYWFAFYVDNFAVTLLHGTGIVFEDLSREMFSILNRLEGKDDLIERRKHNVKLTVGDMFIVADAKCENVKAAELTIDSVVDVEKYKQDAVDTISTWFYLFTSIVNAEKSFILQETPLSYNPNRKEKKILRVHQRPIYTILSPLAIRKKMHIEHPKAERGHHKSPAPHERRRHKRRLRVESGYKENRDIIIEAMWVGESEKKIGNKIYKVRLDL